MINLSVTNLLSGERFQPTGDRVKVSAQHPDFPGTDAFCGDGVHMWKICGKEVYKKEFAPSTLFIAVDLGSEKVITGADVLFANQIGRLVKSRDFISRVDKLCSKYDLVYTSDKALWDSLPEPSNTVCEYDWKKEGWCLAGSTETEGMWADITLGGNDFAFDRKTLPHAVLARYVMISFSLIGLDQMHLPHWDMGLADWKLYGRDQVKNTIAVSPANPRYVTFRPEELEFTFPKEKRLKALSLHSSASLLAPVVCRMLAQKSDYLLEDGKAVLPVSLLKTLAPGDHQLMFQFMSGETAVLPLVITSFDEGRVLVNAIPGVSPFQVLGEGFGTDEPVEGPNKRMRSLMPDAACHVQNRYDEELGREVFSFQVHTPDCLGCYGHKSNYNAQGEWEWGDTSRQRVELRPSTDTGDDLIAVEGEITRYTWKWRLAEDFPVNERFNHLFQLKAVNSQRKGTIPGYTNSGSENGMPILSFYAVDEKFRLIQADPMQNMMEIACVPMDKVRGRWVSVELEVLHADDGCVKVHMADLKSGEVLMDATSHCDTWRRPYQVGVGELDYPACYNQYNRPKWGIYRKVPTTEQNPLPPAHLEIADLSIVKVKKAE